MPFYLQYLAKWPEYCFTADAPGGRAMGYVLGKAESFASERNSWHGHVTAVTVPPEYRRLGMASRLMGVLEEAGCATAALLDATRSLTVETWLESLEASRPAFLKSLQEQYGVSKLAERQAIANKLSKAKREGRL